MYEKGGRPFDEGTSSEKTDFGYILNKQIERISLMGSMGATEQFSESISTLDIMLDPYKDTFFDEQRNKLDTQYLDIILSFEPRKRNEMQNKYTGYFARRLLTLLMNLMSRKGLIPTRRISAMDR